jgi:hypothetical protein
MYFDSTLVHLYYIIFVSLLFEDILRARGSLFETVISSYRQLSISIFIPRPQESRLFTRSHPMSVINNPKCHRSLFRKNVFFFFFSMDSSRPGRDQDISETSACKKNIYFMNNIIMALLLQYLTQKSFSS